MEIDGKQYAQQRALEDFAAKKAGLIPKDPIERLRCDEARELLAELYAITGRIMGLQGEE